MAAGPGMPGVLGLIPAPPPKTVKDHFQALLCLFVVDYVVYIIFLSLELRVKLYSHAAVEIYVAPSANLLFPLPPPPKKNMCSHFQTLSCLFMVDYFIYRIIITMLVLLLLIIIIKIIKIIMIILYFSCAYVSG